MTQGISTLPGAQQNPGQAAPLQALPSQQPKTPQAVTGQLENLPPQQLLMMFNNPTDSTPKWAVMTAYAKAIEQQKLMNAARGQAAMQQGQMQAQQPPVAAQVMSQPLPQHTQYARHGGVMQGYADGGLTLGYVPDYQDARRLGIDLSPYDPPEVRAQKLERLKNMRAFEARLKTEGQAEIPNEYADRRIAAGYRDPNRAKLDVAPPPAAVETNLTSVNSIPAIEMALRDPSTPKNERDALEAALVKLHEKRAANAGITDLSTPSAAPAPTAPSARPTGGGVATLGVSPTLAPGITEEATRQATELEKRKALPPELTEARKGLAALEASNIEAQRAATGAYGKESEAALEAARKAREASRFGDIQYLGQMLEGMRGAKTFGEALAGAGAGAGRAESGRAALLREAEKIRREDQRLIRTEEAATRQMQVLSAQRVLAERQGDFDRVNQIDDKIASIKMGLEQAKQGQAEKAAEFGLKAREAAAKELTAQAAMAGATARQGASGLAEQKLALQAMKADPAYTGVAKELTEATKLAAMSKSPMAQNRLKAAQEAAKKLADAYGVTPDLMGMGVSTAATASTAPSGNDPLGIRKP